MIAQERWMMVNTADERPEHAFPARVREVLALLRGDGYRCEYYGEIDARDVYLVGGASRDGRLTVRDDGSLEVWEWHPDPNGAPMTWGRFDAGRSTGGREASALLREVVG